MNHELKLKDHLTKDKLEPIDPDMYIDKFLKFMGKDHVTISDAMEYADMMNKYLEEIGTNLYYRLINNDKNKEMISVIYNNLEFIYNKFNECLSEFKETVLPKLNDPSKTDGSNLVKFYSSEFLSAHMIYLLYDIANTGFLKDDEEEN